MTGAELNKFKKILESRQAELEQIVGNWGGIVIEKSADALERELAIPNLYRVSNRLRNVQSALRRIEDGSFEEEISSARLAAVPWAPFCIRRQERADRNHDNGNELFHEFLVNAA
jgi:RNA polymerase-binding transcription factor DksA